MKTNTKAFIVSHIVVFMTGVAIAAAVFHREDPPAYQQPPMFTYEEANQGCSCPDSLGADDMVEADTLWIQYKPAKR